MTPETIPSTAADFIKHYELKPEFRPVSYKTINIDQTCVTVNLLTEDRSYVSKITSVRGVVILLSNHTQKQKIIGFSLVFSKKRYDEISSRKLFHLLLQFLQKDLKVSKNNWRIFYQLFWLVLKHPSTWVIK